MAKKSYLVVRDHFEKKNCVSGHNEVLAVIAKKSAALPLMMQESGAHFMYNIHEVSNAGELEEYIGEKGVNRILCADSYDQDEYLGHITYVVNNDFNEEVDVYTVMKLYAADEHGVAEICGGIINVFKEEEACGDSDERQKLIQTFTNQVYHIAKEA